MGSGMALKHSSIVAITAFYVLVERDFALVPSIAANHGVHAYFRYQDEGLYVLAEVSSSIFMG